MDILIVGNTAREHILAWKFAESRKIGNLYCTSPYSGVDTLCIRVDEPLSAWRATHPVDFTIGEDDACLYQASAPCPIDRVRVTVDCLTDGHRIVPLPAVRILYTADGEAYAAETPARAYTPDIAHRAYHRYFVPYIRIHNGNVSSIRGLIRFELMICDGEPELLTVNRGFGELDALALLPLLRGELFGVLKACVDGGLTQEVVHIQKQACVVLMLGAKEMDVPVSGLAEVAKNTGVFMGTVHFGEGQMQTAGRRALFVCGKGPDIRSAARLACNGAEKIAFDGIVRYQLGHGATTI